jgi:hypothetical protein
MRTWYLSPDRVFRDQVIPKPGDQILSARQSFSASMEVAASDFL